jgi:hypothetical protein
MPVYLNEAQTGCDRALIGFPNLLLCMGFVVQTKAWLYGIHFDAPSQTDALAGALRGFIVERGGQIGNAVAIYGACNWNERYRDSGKKKDAWKAEMRAIASMLGYKGSAAGFDTSIIPSTNKGRYVEYHPDYPQERCRIYYKGQDNADFTSSGLAPAAALKQMRGNVHTYKVFNQQPIEPKGNVTLTTASTATGLAELDYALRLETFKI